MSASPSNSLGDYLRDRRTRLDPAALGFPGGRRRTPGLRREEVAQRANISPTWYTWLEQGRGGAPSAAVLHRIAAGLMLTEPEREHLFMLGLGRPPEAAYRPSEGVSPRLQRVLDALGTSPAMVKTVLWDVVAWNAAASALFGDFAAVAPPERNTLRRLFLNPRAREGQEDWLAVARAVVGAFRADVARVGAGEAAQRLVEELERASPEFAEIWRDHQVGAHGEGAKRIHHPVAGTVTLDFNGFTVDGRPDLGLIVYTPSTPADADKIAALMATAAAQSRSGAPSGK